MILAPDVVCYLWVQEFRCHHYILKPKSAFVEEEKKVGEEDNFLETMTRHEKRTSYDGEEIIKRMEPIFEDMNKNIMKGFECLSIQSREKYIDFK